MQTSGKQFGPVRVASDLLRESGVASFYRGVASPVVGAALIKSFVFGGYGFCQSIVRRALGKGNSGRYFIFSDAYRGCSTDQVDTVQIFAANISLHHCCVFFSPSAFFGHHLSFSRHISARLFLFRYPDVSRNVDMPALLWNLGLMPCRKHKWILCR